MNVSTNARTNRLTAVLILAAPAVGTLAVLAVVGALDWRYAIGGSLAVLAGVGIVLWRHFRQLEVLRRFVAMISRGGPECPPPAEAKAAAQLLCPGLGGFVTESLLRQQVGRRQLEAVVAGNESILASLPDPLIMLDSERHIVRANPAAEALFGTDLASRDLATALRNPALLDAANAVLAGETAQIVEFSLPGGLERHFSSKVLDLSSPAPDGTVAILSLHDMTGVRRAEQLRADFVANASHELRTPLASLLGFIETLSGPARDDEEARVRFLTIMHDQTQRMTHLVEDLLSLSRIEMQEHTQPDVPADLERVLRSISGTLEMKAREKNMTIKMEAKSLPPVLGDADELAQVFQNLIDNAIKYGRDGTVVGVTAGPDANASHRLGREAVAVTITDEGDGIAREHLSRLTERFYRVDTARSRKLGGTGLGLAIVKHIVNRHRGALEIASEVGKGSSFTVHLPVAIRATMEAAVS